MSKVYHLEDFTITTKDELRALLRVEKAARCETEGWGYAGGVPNHHETHHALDRAGGLTQKNCRSCCLERALYALDALRKEG